MQESLFAGDGEMCALMRSHDWSQTPLGPVEQWPQSLRTTVSIVVSTGHPMVLFWGQDLIQFYNDGYRPAWANTNTLKPSDRELQNAGQKFGILLARKSIM